MVKNLKIETTITLQNNTDEIILPVAKFTKGNYVVSIIADGKIVFSDKLIKK